MTDEEYNKMMQAEYHEDIKKSWSGGVIMIGVIILALVVLFIYGLFTHGMGVDIGVLH
jgi:hypothetical protein